MKEKKESIILMMIASVGYLLFCSSLPSFIATVLKDMLGGNVNQYYLALSLAIGIMYVSWLYKKHGEKIEITKNVTVKGFLEALVVGFVLFLVINFAIMPLLGMIFTASEANYVRNLEQMYETPAVTFFQVVVVAPVLEELVYRGLLLKRELRYQSVTVAVCMVAFFFGALHMSIVQGIGAFVAGVILCLFFAKRGSVGLTIAAHSFYNGLTFFLLLYNGGF